MKQLMRAIVVGSACALLVACHGDRQMKGNGKVVSDVRPVGSIQTLKVNGDIIVTLSSNQSTPSLEIRVDQNLLPYITSQYANNTLSIAVKPRYHLTPSSPIQVVINTPDLRMVNLAGGVTFVASNLKGDDFDLSVKGAGTTVLKGQEKSVNFTVDGTAHVNAAELMADNVQVKMFGLPQLTVNTSKKLGVYIKGKGQLTFFGEPATVDQEIYDGGKLVRGS